MTSEKLRIFPSFQICFVAEQERKQNGRANSRFRGLNRISLLFPKRKPFIPNTGTRGRSTESPFTTTDQDIVLTGFGSRSTQRPFTTPTTRAPAVVVTTATENSIFSLFRGRSTRPPFRPRVRTTRYVFYNIPMSPQDFIISYCHVYIKGAASISKCKKVVFSALYNLRPTK